MQQDDRTGVFQDRHDFEQNLNLRKYFWAVAQAYISVLETPALCAISYDDEFPNRKLGAQMIEFKCDVYLANVAALNGNPSLLEDWNRLVINGEKVPNANSIINRCSRVYRSRKLIPHVYFTVIKKGRKRRHAGAA
jgi:hypothetical protein